MLELWEIRSIHKGLRRACATYLLWRKQGYWVIWER